MNLLTAPWIPVRGDGGAGKFRLLTYEELLCHEDEGEEWRISLPRDDLELACLQLLICLTQVIFLPTDEQELRWRLMESVKPKELADRVVPLRDWFDLDHPAQPFMQTRGVKAEKITPIQKLFIGLPEGNNHAFFNDVGELRRVGAAGVAIALFNQASNCPNFGGSFMGSLRGGAPTTTLVMGDTLCNTIWRNVITLSRVRERLPNYEPDFTQDKPTWVEPFTRNEVIYSSRIGLMRGLFWQPAHIELVSSDADSVCDLMDGEVIPTYKGFLCEKFPYKMQGVWPHPHGVMIAVKKKGKLEHKFSSFTTTAPAWTQLSEFVVPGLNAGTGEGTTPAAPVQQASQLDPGQLHLIVGGYRNKQAAVLERRHELISLAQGWSENSDYLVRLVNVGKEAKTILRGKLYYAVQGDKKKELKGLGAPVHETGEKLFYSHTEGVLHEFLQDSMTFKEYKAARRRLAELLGEICKQIFNELTDPYAHKPELIPIIAVTRRSMNYELHNLVEGDQQNANTRKKQKRTKA
jgi:CRISPR system Cascade subunit CasA